MGNDVGIYRRNAEERGMMWEYTEGIDAEEDEE